MLHAVALMQVHHAYRHTQLALLKGHVSAVTDLCFSSDERLLCSTGAGGALYFWDLATGASPLADAFSICVVTSGRAQSTPL